jgi:hypothetical protein
MAKVQFKEQFVVNSSEVQKLGLQNFNKNTKQLVRAITNKMYDCLKDSKDKRYVLQLAFIELDERDIEFMQAMEHKNAVNKGS